MPVQHNPIHKEKMFIGLLIILRFIHTQIFHPPGPHAKLYFIFRYIGIDQRCFPSGQSSSYTDQHIDIGLLVRPKSVQLPGIKPIPQLSLRHPAEQRIFSSQIGSEHFLQRPSIPHRDIGTEPTYTLPSPTKFISQFAHQFVPKHSSITIDNHLPVSLYPIGQTPYPRTDLILPDRKSRIQIINSPGSCLCFHRSQILFCISLYRLFFHPTPAQDLIRIHRRPDQRSIFP